MSRPTGTRLQRSSEVKRGTATPLATARVQTGVRRHKTQEGETRRGPHPIIWSLLLFVLSLGLLAAIVAGKFRVHQVEVVGQGLPRSEIVRVSGVMGQNIFTVRSDQVVARLASIREIAVRRVDTAFPDRITIYAQTRTPIVGWRQGKRLVLLDADGRIVKQAPSTKLPVVTSANGRGALGPGAVTAVRVAVRLLPTAPDGAIASLSYDPRDGLTITGRAGWRAIIGTGTPRRMVTRVASLVGVLQKAKYLGRPLQLVDLRYSTPYAKFGP